jgi:hypothetical protein
MSKLITSEREGFWIMEWGDRLADYFRFSDQKGDRLSKYLKKNIK